MMHPFFEEIQKYPELASEVNFELTKLPEPYVGKRKIKAILLGADPTNDGTKEEKGLIRFDTVFGINSKYEDDFFGPQKRNLESLGISKDNLFIQNVCRNYFTEQTSKNKNWNQVAELWIKYLKAGLKEFHKLPILVTAEKVMRAITHNSYKADDLYTYSERFLPIWSENLRGEVYPLYRNHTYQLSIHPEYTKFLKKILS